MFTDSLIPILNADYIRITHNEQSFERKSAQAFIRAKKLTRAFADLTDLRKAIEYNSLWTVEIVRLDSSSREVYAAPHFTAVLKAGGTSMLEMDAMNSEIAPPFPRHEGLILECVREQNLSQTWTMKWRDEIGNQSYQLKSTSVQPLLLCGLEICAGKAEAKLEAFERYTVAH